MRNLHILTRMTASLCLVFIFQSCSKDADLLSEYVITKDENATNLQTYVVNDVFYINNNSDIILDVLNNDNFEELSNVSIINTTTAQNGNIEINNDNTLTYTPKEEVIETEEFEDSFTYTAEEVEEDGTVTQEVGTVTVTNNESSRIAGVNFSVYGAIGDGINDDTAAIQAAIDAESNLIANENSVFKVTKVIDIDTKKLQYINWNNSTILASNNLNPVMKIDKRGSNGGTTEMENLFVDGNNIAIRGIEIRSRVIFNHINISDLNQGSQALSPAGIYQKVNNDEDSVGEYIFNNCNISNLVGNSDCIVASNTNGSVNGYLFYWEEVPAEKTTITFNNLNVDGMWGDDGGGVFINDHVNIGSSESGHIFNNCTIKNYERRALKGFSSNMKFTNCIFEDPDSNDERIHCGTNSGLAVFGGENGKVNIQFISCDFISKGYDGRLIPINITNFLIDNCNFIGGSDIAFTQTIGDGVIENCTFSKESTIYAYGATFEGLLKISKSNTTENPNYIKLNILDYLFE